MTVLDHSHSCECVPLVIAGDRRSRGASEVQTIIPSKLPYSFEMPGFARPKLEFVGCQLVSKANIGKLGCTIAWKNGVSRRKRTTCLGANGKPLYLCGVQSVVMRKDILGMFWSQVRASWILLFQA